MNRTAYDSGNRIARIEPGSNWGLVYEALIRMELPPSGDGLLLSVSVVLPPAEGSV